VQACKKLCSFNLVQPTIARLPTLSLGPIRKLDLTFKKTLLTKAISHINFKKLGDDLYGERS